MSMIETYRTVQFPQDYKINWRAFYEEADELTAQVRRELPHTLDTAYGDDPKQRLDLYMPTESSGAAGVFVFLHGGGFCEGDRAHYGFVARPLAANGIVTVVASYRLTPQAHYPDQPHDVQQILGWVHRNIGDQGGDTDRVYVGGHSAGAILAAFAGLDNGWTSAAGVPPDIIKGVVAISGIYDLRDYPATAEYVHDPGRATEASPLFNVVTPTQTIAAAGSLEEPYVEQAHALVDAIRRKGGLAEAMVLEDFDHSHTVRTLHEPASPLVRAILDMMAP